KEVFNWRRLVWHAVWLVLLTVGLWVLVGAVWSLFASAGPNASPLAGYGRLEEKARIWTRRNALMDTQATWPRRSYLEVLSFPGKVKRDSSEPANIDVRVRAYQWVIADSDSRYGYRPLKWSDVDEKLLGSTVPDLPRGLKLRGADKW